MKRKERVESENVNDLLVSMNNPNEPHMGTVRKYAAPFGRIKRDETLTSADKIALIEKLVAKIEKEQIRLSKLEKVNDVTEKVTAQGGICLPIGIGAACLGFCAAMITTIFGDAFGMDPTAIKTLSENIAMAGGMSFIASLGVGVATVPIEYAAISGGTNCYSKIKTLEQIQGVFEAIKATLKSELEKAQTKGLGV